MKTNPFALRPVTSEAETRTFHDSHQPDNDLTITLQPPSDPSVEMAIAEMAGRNIETYITNKGPLLPVRGRTVTLSESLCNLIAALQVLESPEGGDKPYDFHSWAALFVTHPDAMREVTAWASDMLVNARQPEGED